MSVDVAVLNESRRFTTATATMRRDGQPVLSVLSTLGDLRETTGPEAVTASPPSMPRPEECIGLAEAGDEAPPPFSRRVDLRLHPDDAGFFAGRPSGAARMRGWFRLRDDEEIDALGLLCAADAFPPTIFNSVLPRAWTPTIELTAHIRALPAPGWLRCSFETCNVTGGFLEEDGVIWDTAGRLVAQSRQLALVPRAPA